jgi:Holliday junction DNA helicase RuvB
VRAYRNIKSGSSNPTASFGPTIFAGPAGVGKTLTAKSLHRELGNRELVETNGLSMNDKFELFSVLICARADTTVFIDEAQGMNSKAQHILLTALSEKKLYVPNSMSSTSSCTLPLANFTVILATTHEYLLQDALRNRMKIYCRFEYYSTEDLTEIVCQRADALNWKYESDRVLQVIARGAKGTPRLALNRNLETCWYVTRSHNRNVMNLQDVQEAFHYLQIDEFGLDKLDRSYLMVLRESGRSRLSVLSSRLSLPSLTLQRVLEPYLLKEGLIIRDDSSIRVITRKGRQYLETTSPLFGQATIGEAHGT